MRGSAWALRTGCKKRNVGQSENRVRRKEDALMLNWSITFLVIALIAGVLGLSGVAGAAANIAWTLFVVFLILFVVGLVMGRRPPI